MSVRVFISWSGERSRALAGILHKWLPATLQAVQPYFTPDDIAKGARWFPEIAKELDASRIGLLCLTADNLTAPWMMFEAGALAKSLEKSRVCPLLFGVEPSDLSGPLAQFQAARFDRAEFHRVLKMINAELGAEALPTEVLDMVFGKWWPDLERDVGAELKRPGGAGGTQGSARPEREMLKEVLELTRALMRRQQETDAPDHLQLARLMHKSREPSAEANEFGFHALAYLSTLNDGLREIREPHWPTWDLGLIDNQQVQVLVHDTEGVGIKSTLRFPITTTPEVAVEMVRSLMPAAVRSA